VLTNQIITSEGAPAASAVTYLLPVVIVLGVLVLDEHITILVLIGIALILVGVSLTRNRDSSSDLNDGSGEQAEQAEHSPRA
jgi:drug/metabolite transporter (DMT)-like permease